jgi:histidinol-phosphatase
MTVNAEWRARYEKAVEAARQAGQLALRYFDCGTTVEWKQDRSPVTVADRDAESLLRTALLGAFPDDGFLGEEHGEKPGTSGYRWIIDPIDGTRSFVRNIPLWGTLVGLEYQGEAIAGVAEVPALRQTFRALRGDGAWRDDRRIHVTDVSDLSKATIFYTSLSWFMKAGRQQEFVDLVTRTQTQRGYGDFYGHVLVAQGSGEAMVEHGVHIWDVAAIQPIVEEAGGRFTDWDGNRTIERVDVVASNGKLHDEVLRLLRKKDPSEEDVVIQTPNGPRIKGTRVTIYDVYYYTLKGHHHTYIAAMLHLSSREVMEVQKYVEEHKDEVHAVHEQIEARIARGHPPEVQAKIDATHAKYAALFAERRRKYPLEGEDERNSGGH